jgi:exodeoxyribonuclease-3
MIVGTWNVNSIRQREARLFGVLERHKPDVLCLQELKGLDECVPVERLAAQGYRAVMHAQKTYNGVAILSRAEPEDVVRGFGDGVEDPQARFLSARVAGLRVLCAYVPNGSELDSDKYRYKLEWLARLRAYLERTHKPDEPLVLCGDLNVAPDDSDVARPDEWRDTVLAHTSVREALARVTDWGLFDAFRKHHPAGGVYSWWDYRGLGFPKNNGLRIDHVLATRPVLERCTAASVDRDERKGVQPSDHAPVFVTLAE